MLFWFLFTLEAFSDIQSVVIIPTFIALLAYHKQTENTGEWFTFPINVNIFHMNGTTKISNMEYDYDIKVYYIND